MLARLIGFPVAHWRGQVALLPTLALTLVGLRLAVAWAGGIVPLAADAGLFAWQVVGSLRAIARHQRDMPDFLASVAGYAAVLATVPLFLWPQIDRFSARYPPPRPAPEPTGLSLTRETATLSGPIGFAMFAALDRALAADPGIGRAVLDSSGGRVFAARGIARLVRENGLDTHVDATCASACALIYIAGNRRTLGPDARLGFHGYAMLEANPFIETGPEQARDRAAFLSRGIAPDFVDRMFRAGPDEMWFPSRAELAAAGVLTPP